MSNRQKVRPGGRRRRAWQAGDTTPADDFACPACGHDDGFMALTFDEYLAHCESVDRDAAVRLVDSFRGELLTWAWCHCCGWGGALMQAPSSQLDEGGALQAERARHPRPPRSFGLG